MSGVQTSQLRYAAYGLLGLPLAMAALPVYVQIPAYYTTRLGMSLVSVGWVLFLARFVDALQDPLLGYLIDRLPGSLTVWFGTAGVLLAAAFYGLWLPPLERINLMFWLGGMLVLAYLAHSMLNIAYLAWGARINQVRNASLLDAAAWREAAGLIGVIAASVIPGVIFSSQRVEANLGGYCLAFAVLLIVAIIALLTAAPRWQRVRAELAESAITLRQQWQIGRGNRPFLYLLPPYFINAISVSIPATLVVFFIQDRLQAPDYLPAFLASYFIAAAVGLPVWVMLAKRWSVAICWRIGMLLAIVTFISAGMLSAGQILPFAVICIASGFALGADLALPPVLLAQAIQPDDTPAVYYGVWTLLGKFALAISGLALPLLASFGYQPGHPANAVLALVYAGIPCALKCIALILLMRHVTPFPVRTV